MSCVNLVFAVAILEIFSFILIVQAIMALHYGVYHRNILISFIVLGENVWNLSNQRYGIYQIKRIVSS
jgi:DNA-directed RNA polymerase delta subunit